MGMFMTLGAVDAPAAAVQDALQQAKETVDGFGGGGAMARGPERTLVFFAGDEYLAAEACAAVSASLNCCAFHIHIHDGDLWMYEFYVKGEKQDQFNTTPGYWEEISDAERKAWQGDPDVIARHWPGVEAQQISRYLIHCSEEQMREKAYDSDEFYYWDCWQFTDFLGRLGVSYPEDDEIAEQGG